MTEMGTVTVVRNAAIMVAVVATVVSNGLWLLLVLPLLCALWLLALGLLRALRLLAFCLLGALWLLALRLLGALRLRLMLRRLGTLRLCLLVLRLLGALRLRLVLRRLGFASASALSLLAFLC